MGMMIENHIEVLKSYHNGFTGCAGNLQESIDVAVDIMCKYKKIEQLVKDDFEEYHPLDRNSYKLYLIRKVLEDGNDGQG